MKFSSSLTLIAAGLFASFSHLEAELAYAVQLGSPANIQVFDTATNTLVDTIPLDGDATDTGTIIFNADGSLGYVRIDEELLVLNTETSNIIATLPVGGVGLTTMTSNGQFVYAVNRAGNSVNAINTTLNAIVATISVGSGAFGITTADTSAGERIYVAKTTSVAVINPNLQAVVATIAGISISGQSPQAVSTPNGDFVYIGTTGQQTIVKIDTSTNTAIATIPLDIFPAGIVVNSAGTLVYALDLDAGDPNLIEVIEVSSDMVIATIPVSFVTGAINYLALSPDGAFLYAGAGAGAGGVFIIDTMDNTEIGSIAGTSDNFGIGIQPIAPPPPTPSGSTVLGKQTAYRFLTQTDYVNDINWIAPSGFTPVSYRIYRNAGLTNLAGITSASTLEFQDHNRVKTQSYTYYVVAVNGSGNTLLLGSVTL